MAEKVAGDLYESITGQLFEIGRQLRQHNGYPFEAERLHAHLQKAIEGRFPELLECVATVTVAAHERFAVAEHVKVDVSEHASVQIQWLSERFVNDYLDLAEGPAGLMELRIHKLHESVSSRLVARTLGGVAAVTINFQHLFALVAKQGKGEAGPLLIDGSPNYATIRNAHNFPDGVAIIWDTDTGGWLFREAAPGRRNKGSQFITY